MALSINHELARLGSSFHQACCKGHVAHIRLSEKQIDEWMRTQTPNFDERCFWMGTLIAGHTFCPNKLLDPYFVGIRHFWRWTCPPRAAREETTQRP